MLAGLDAEIQAREAVFEPEGGAYGHHHHSHGRPRAFAGSWPGSRRPSRPAPMPLQPRARDRRCLGPGEERRRAGNMARGCASSLQRLQRRPFSRSGLTHGAGGREGSDCRFERARHRVPVDHRAPAGDRSARAGVSHRCGEGLALPCPIRSPSALPVPGMGSACSQRSSVISSPSPPIWHRLAYGSCRSTRVTG